MREPSTITPIVARCLAGLLFLFEVMPAVARAVDWSAEDAVARALSNPEASVRRETRLRAIRAEMGEVTSLPVPSLAFAHEKVGFEEATEVREFSVMWEQPIGFGLWRGPMRESYRQKEAALLAEDEAWKVDLAADVRSAYFAVRHREARVAALGRWVGRLEDGRDAIATREERGDASLFELRRVERSLGIARSQQAQELSQLEEAWNELRRWAPWDERPHLVDELAPALAESSLPDSVPVDRLPTVAKLEHTLRSLESEERAWGAPFLRDWVLGAGYRYAEEGSDRGDGLLLSLSVPLPLWGPDSARRQRIRAERDRVEGELGLQRIRSARDVQSALQRVRDLRAAVDALPDPQVDGNLSRQAELAYSAGEATLTELLDVYESEVDLMLSRLDLYWESRRAAIELERRKGMGVPR